MGKFVLKEISKIISQQEFTVGTAVETGTLLGSTTNLMSTIFKTVHTIEISQELYEKAICNFRTQQNIICHFGDSSKVLTQIIKLICEPCLFYLDAHWSGDKTVQWNLSSWKGYGRINTGCRNSDPSCSQNQVPLEEEIRCICKYFRYPCIIYIDDMDKFGEDGKGLINKNFQGEDWSHLDKQRLLKCMSTRKIAEYEITDQLIVVLKGLI